MQKYAGVSPGHPPTWVKLISPLLSNMDKYRVNHQVRIDNLVT